MRAEIIAIGDELSSGVRVDTNSAWLSQRLHEVGIRVLMHSTVADDAAALRDVFVSALRRADLVIATGGLGPTADDLTRDALAEALDRPLVRDAAVLEGIERRFTQRGRTMPPQNARQADFPNGSHPIANRHGTAPGIDATVTQNERSVRLFAVPGVPAEMREMWHDHILPTLHDMGAVRGASVVREIKCFGVGESHLESMLPDLIRRGRDPSVGITVHQATITLRIMTSGPERRACEERVAETAELIHRTLGHLVFGEGDDELQHAVVRLLEQRGQSLAVFEWGTPGLLSQWLRQATSKPLFAGGYLCPGDREHRPAWLPAEESAIDVASQTGRLAEEVRRRFLADFGLATGPLSAGALTDPNAEFPIGLAGPEGSDVTQHRVAGHPDIVLERAAKAALNRVRLSLLNQDPSWPHTS